MKLIDQKVYVVNPGDTLSAIAVYFCTDAKHIYNIAEDNGIPNIHFIYPGQRLWINEDYLKEQFKQTGLKRVVDREPYRTGQIVYVDNNGVVERPPLWDLVENTPDLLEGYFCILDSTNQSRLRVKDSQGRVFYFNLDVTRKLLKVEELIMVASNRWMPIN